MSTLANILRTKELYESTESFLSDAAPMFLLCLAHFPGGSGKAVCRGCNGICTVPGCWPETTGSSYDKQKL